MNTDKIITIAESLGLPLAKADQNKIAFGNSYNSGSGIAVPISEVLNVICDITNCKKKHEEECHVL